MTNITDYKRNSMQTVLGSSVGNIDDLEIAYLQAAGATSNNVNDAWYQVFVLNGATSPDWNDAANQFLIALGAIGSSLADRWAWFWITNAGVIASYDPGMMTFDGSTGQYTASYTSTGNKVTLVVRFNRADFTGDVAEYIAQSVKTYVRIRLMLISSNHSAVPNRQGKLQVDVQNSAGAIIYRGISSSVLMDGQDHVALASFDGDIGAGTLIVDGVDEDDTGNADRVAPVTGTLDSGAGTIFYVSGSAGATVLYSGDAGYIGHDESYLTNSSDFMDGSSPKELDETTWTEWGSQPLFWNQYGTMTDNKGSEGNMTKAGTITGPA